MKPVVFQKYKCSKCGKEYQDTISTNPERLCRDCHDLKLLAEKITAIEKQLLAQEFSIEQKDADIVRQINALLTKEGVGTSEVYEARSLATALLEKLFKDEKRREKLIRMTLKLQKKKR